MLNSNLTGQVRKLTGLDRYGQAALGVAVDQRCAIVKLKNEMVHTTVRADSSQSRGHGDEFVSNNKVLIQGDTIAALGDQLVILGFKIKITGMHPRLDVSGRIDHHELTGELWV